MAQLVARTALRLVCRRNVHVSAALRDQKMMPDPLEHATGLEKQELLAKVAGNENPFDMRVYKHAAGTKDQPTKIPSLYDSRIIGCICEEDATCVNWMWLHKGELHRCECGYHFQLTDAKPL